MMGELSSLPNVGKVLENNLNAIGITTIKEFLKQDSQEIFIKIRRYQDSGACLHMLYGIEGAKQGINDSLLSTDTKQALKDFYNAL